MAILGYYTFFVLYSNYRDKSIKTTSGIVETGRKTGDSPRFLDKKPAENRRAFSLPFQQRFSPAANP